MLLRFHASRAWGCARRNVGLLVIKVVEAEGLKKMDTFGKADPFVEAYTQAHQVERTVRSARSRGEQTWNSEGLWDFRVCQVVCCLMPGCRARRAPPLAARVQLSGCAACFACHKVHHRVAHVAWLGRFRGHSGSERVKC